MQRTLSIGYLSLILKESVGIETIVADFFGRRKRNFERNEMKNRILTIGWRKN